MSLEEDKGARPKERPHRDRPTVDYKRMHEGSGLVDVTPGKNRRDTGEAVAALQDGSPGKDYFGSVSAAGSDLGHEDAEKALHDLDREIEEFILSKVEHEKSFIISGSYHIGLACDTLMIKASVV